MATLAYNARRSEPASSSPRLLELDGTRVQTIEAHYKLYQGYVAKRNEISASSPRSTRQPRTRSTRTSARSRSTSRSRSAASRTTRSTSSTSAATAATPTARWRARRARLRLRRRVARRPQGDRHGRPRLGLDGLRLGRGAPLQLRRRRAEHVPDLERDAARRARRLRARVLPRLPTDAPPTSTRSSTTSTGTVVNDWSSRTASGLSA